VLAQFDIVDVGRLADLEHRQQFVPGAPQTSHAGIGLGPDDKVQQIHAQLTANRQRRLDSSPVDEGREHAAVDDMALCRVHPFPNEYPKIRIAHLATGHRKFRMVAAGDVAPDFYIVWHVGEREADGCPFEQPLVHIRILGIAADQPVVTENPQISQPSDDGRLRIGFEICGFKCLVLVLQQDLIDLRQAEAGKLDRSAEVDEFGELHLQGFEIPFGLLRQAIEGEPQQADLLLIEIIDDDAGQAVEAKTARRLENEATVDDLVITGNENGRRDSKSLDASSSR